MTCGATQEGIDDAVFIIIQFLFNRIMNLGFLNIKYVGYLYRSLDRVKLRKIKFVFIPDKSIKYMFWKMLEYLK
jgi:hypothetical protein